MAAISRKKIKELVEFMKREKIQAISLPGIGVTLDERAFSQKLKPQKPGKPKRERPLTEAEREQLAKVQQQEIERVLYHSAG
jgi:hypothetical protein